MEKVWLEEYLKCWNATEAARRAGYAWPRRMGSRKLDKFEDEIQGRIDKLVMSADEALVRLSEIARGEWAEYIKADGSVDIGQMVEDDKTYLLTEIRDTKYGKSIKFCDMQGAIEKIGKAHGVFVNRHEVENKGKLTIEYVNDWRGEPTGE
jgi:hypothetical protein